MNAWDCTKQRDFLESLKDPRYAVGKGVIQAMRDIEAQHADYIKYTETWELNSMDVYHIDIYVRDDIDIYTTENLIIDMEDSIKYHMQKHNTKAIVEFDRHLMYAGQLRNKDKFYIVVRI